MKSHAQMIRLMGVACLLLVLAGAIAGQDMVLRTQSTVVLVPALVKDSDGKPAWNLKVEDFVIQDDGVEQSLKLDPAPDVEPISLVVAIQRGGSAAAEFGRMAGLGALLEPVSGQADARIALVEFDSHVQLIHDFTTDAEAVRKDLKKITPGDGGAAILDAADYSLKLLAKAPDDSLHALLLVCETHDQGSHATTTDLVIHAANNANTVVYTLAFSPSTTGVLDTLRGKNRDAGNTMNLLAPIAMAMEAARSNAPKAVAALAGGEYELFHTNSSFESRLLDFGNHLHARYLLSFQPKDPHSGLHQIKVLLRQPKGFSVTARSNYWVAQK